MIHRAYRDMLYFVLQVYYVCR